MGKDEVITATIIIKDLSSQRNIEYPYDNMKTIEEYKKQVLQVCNFFIFFIQELYKDSQLNTDSFMLSLSNDEKPLENKKTLKELDIDYPSILECIFCY